MRAASPSILSAMRGSQRRRIATGLLTLGLLCALPATAPADEPAAAPADEPVDFATQILPILSDRCALCHGPDEASREAEMRVDVPDVVGQPTQNGGLDWIIAAGDASASELIRRIESDDAGERMPPPESKLELSTTEINLLRRWIDEGANWEAHWSFQPLAQPPIPQPAGPQPAGPQPAGPQPAGPQPAGPPDSKATTAIDRFINHRLLQHDLSPSPTDSRESLVRRLTLDLTGLPPSPDLVARFLADDSPNAYERLVDHLLADPAVGERLAVPWLDVARYADTYGYQSDVYREVWPWRDWVVDAFRQSMPYDQFITWQIAGDLLPDATRESRLATAFNRLHRQTNEGGSVEEEFRAEYISDRVHTLGTAVLGLTLECARCHDHKYDPISQRDYYSLAAFFTNIDESGLYSHFTNYTPTPALDLPTPAQEQALAAAKQRAEQAAAAYHAALAAAVSNADPAPLPDPDNPLADEIAHFSFGPRNALVETPTADQTTAPDATNAVAAEPAGQLTGGPKLTRRGDGDPALLLDGENGFQTKAGGDWDWWQPFSIALWVRPSQLHDRAVILHRSRAWTDAASCGYELLLEDGRLSFAMIHFWPGDAVRIRATQPLEIDSWSHVTLVSDGSGRAAGMRIYVDGNPVESTVVRDKLRRTIRGGGANQLVIGNRFRDRGFKQGAVDELRIFQRDLTPAEVTRVATGSWPSDTPDALRQSHAHSQNQTVRELRTTLTQARQQLAAARDRIRSIMTMRESPGLHETHILRRGSYESPGEKIEQPDVPEALGRLPDDTPANRLGLARWLTASAPAARHPLTARVAVNRVWQMFFDRGLVHTAEDFGLQGSPPSHPQLLDYLACQLIEHDWDIQRLVRDIVLSDAYRRSPNGSPELRERDPDNVWLARGPAQRWPIETLRDSALTLAGLLDRTQGGPPVKPYQPDGLWREKSGGAYQRQAGAPSHRRSLYTIWKRTSPPPSMMLFDAPGREVCTAKRTVTQTPLQALVMLNDEQFVEAARGIAFTLLKPDESAGDRTLASRLVTHMLHRAASDAEIEVLTQLVRQQEKRFAGDPQATQSFLEIGDFRPPADSVTPSRLAAWTIAAQTIMNLDEWLTR